MKEELEKLGFEYNHSWKRYKFKLEENFVVVTIHKDVFLQDVSDSECVYLFPYNHEKLKQLINILS